MAESKRAVLMTGCSDGGAGAALAQEFHRQGLHVYATARDVSKMASLTALGIETLVLDISSDASIKECSQKITRLDILVNNAAVLHTMPVMDLDIAEAKKTFDTNVWGQIALTQAFLPLLRKSPKAMIVNHTSVGSTMSIPFQAAYNASKAAFSMFSDTLRLELQPFGITVVNLKTGEVKTNVLKNAQARDPKLPEGSLYAPVRQRVETALRVEWLSNANTGTPPEQWAKEVVGDLLKPSPPPNIWRGTNAGMARFASCLPFGWFDGFTKKMIGLNEIEREIRKQQSAKSK